MQLRKKRKAAFGQSGRWAAIKWLCTERFGFRFRFVSYSFSTPRRGRALEKACAVGYDMVMENKKTQAAQDKKNNDLIDAAICGDQSAISKALAGGSNPLGTDAGGFTALMWAARYDLGGCAQMLLPVSNLNQFDPAGRSALRIAQDGAGPDSVCAKLIGAYALAMGELAAIGASAAIAAKSQPKKFRL